MANSWTGAPAHIIVATKKKSTSSASSSPIKKKQSLPRPKSEAEMGPSNFRELEAAWKHWYEKGALMLQRNKGDQLDVGMVSYHLKDCAKYFSDSHSTAASSRSTDPKSINNLV